MKCSVTIEWYKNKQITTEKYTTACFSGGWRGVNGVGFYINPTCNEPYLTKEEQVAWLSDLKEMGLWINQDPEAILADKLVFHVSDWGPLARPSCYGQILCGVTLPRYIQEETLAIREYFKLLKEIPDITKLQAVQLVHYTFGGWVGGGGHTALNLARRKWGSGGRMYKYQTIEQLHKSFETTSRVQSVFQPESALLKTVFNTECTAQQIHEVLLVKA